MFQQQPSSRLLFHQYIQLSDSYKLQSLLDMFLLDTENRRAL